MAEQGSRFTFTFFFVDDTLEHLVVSTHTYAEYKKAQKQLMYLQFKKSSLTKEEMMRYIGVSTLTIRVIDDSTSSEGYIDSDSSSEYLPPAANQRNRRYHEFTGHPTVSTELEEMDNDFCSPNSIAREGPAVSQETWRSLIYVQDERKVEPTIKLVEDQEMMNDFLT